LIRLAGNVRGLCERCVLGQPDINVGEIKIVARKELTMELGDEDNADREDDGRSGKNSPAMIDGLGDRARVVPAEPCVARPVRAGILGRLQDLIRQ